MRLFLLVGVLGAGTACGGGVDDTSPTGAAGASAAGAAGASATGAAGTSEEVLAPGPDEGGAAETRTCPTGGDPQPPIAFDGDLAASSTSTTPTELTICLNQNVDRVVLLSQVSSRARPTTPCITREVLRIGRNPTPWEAGSLRAFELRYSEVLAAGAYVEETTAIIAAPGFHLVAERTARFFEVDGAGLRPISSEQFESASAPAIVPTEDFEPCPAWNTFGDVPNDELPASETVSVIDVDDWATVATLQPLRHEVNDLEQPVSKSSTLRFEAWSAQRQHLAVQLEYLPEAGVDFETDQFSLQLQQPDRVYWHSRSGRVIVSEHGGEQLEVRLSGVVLEKGRTIDEPEVTRALPDGSIVGSVARLCRTPISELVDSTWSSPFCDQIRQTAGF